MTVKPREMLTVFEKIGTHLKQPSIYAMVKSMDSEENNAKGLDFEQFLTLSSEYFNDRSSQEGLARIFHLFDSTNRGYLTRGDVWRVLTELDIQLSSEQVEHIFRRASTDEKHITI